MMRIRAGKTYEWDGQCVQVVEHKRGRYQWTSDRVLIRQDNGEMFWLRSSVFRELAKEIKP